MWCATTATMRRCDVAEPLPRFWGIEPLSHAAQVIHAAEGNLLDVARDIATVTDAKRLLTIARALRDRLEVVISVAADKVDELSMTEVARG